MTTNHPEMSQSVYDQAAKFRQATGGVPVIVYIQKGVSGFRVEVRMNDGSSAAPLVENLVNVLGMACQQCGMTVKM
jgi:hypothetical protein